MDKPIDRRTSGDNGVVSAKEQRSARTDEITPDFIAAIKDGNIEIFEKFYTSYQKTITSYLSSMLYSVEDAEEITQDIFTEIWQNHADFNPAHSLKSYMFGIARKKALMCLRSRVTHHKYVQHEQFMHQDYAASPDEILSGDEMNRLMQEAIDRMPEQRRRAYILSRDEGMTYDEIAQTMGLAKGTVHRHIKLALQEVKKVASRITTVIFF